ncbi:MAG: MlaD family protein, partial [Desulfonatronovibrionaceae bacterium]
MKQKISTEVKVGIFVLAAFVLLAYMTTRITRGTSITRDTYTVYAVFKNVSGLKPNSPVEIAGINIGTISSIALDNNQARVKMSVKKDVTIYQDANVSIRTRGVLGDKFVEISPGSPQAGPVQDQATISRTIQPTDIDQIMDRVGDIAEDLRVLSSSVSHVFGGPEGEAGMREAFTNLRQASVHLNELIQANTRGINLIVDNLENFSQDLVSMSQANKQGIGNIISNFETASTQLNTTLKQVNSILATAETGQGPVATLLKDQEMSSSMKETVASLESVSKKLDKGRGTLGKLISDDQTGRKLDQALDSMN